MTKTVGRHNRSLLGSLGKIAESAEARSRRVAKICSLNFSNEHRRINTEPVNANDKE